MVIASARNHAARVGNLAVLLAVVAALAGPFAVTSARAQQQPEKSLEGQVGGLRFIDASEVTVVNVDTRVSDRNGPVLGLTAADFEVFQDGKPQELTNFAFYSTDRTATAQATPAVPVEPGAAPLPTAVAVAPEVGRVPVFLVIYVDNENIAPFNRNRVLNRLDEFLHERFAPPDQAMVVAYQKSMKVLQPFTDDMDEVVAALVAVKKYVGGRTEVNSSRRQIEDELAQMSESTSSGSSSAGGTASSQLQRAMGMVRSFAQEQRNTLVFTVRTLQELVAMLGGLPGKKALLYLSDGLPMNPGMELYYEVQEKFRDPGVLSQAREFDATDLFRGLVTSATAAGVTLYTIDGRGLQSELGIEAENRQSRSTTSAFITQTNYQDSLLYMAEQTGGIAIVNSNDPAPGLKKIGDDIATYYSLGYRLTPSGQDRIHRIEVKVKGCKDCRVTYRKSFIEKSLPARIGDRVVSGLTFELDDNPLGIELSAGDPSPASGGRWTLPVEIRIPIEHIALVPEGEVLSGMLTAYYAARDDEGKQSDLQNTEHAVKIPAAEYESARRQHFTVAAQLLLEPGRYRVSVGVRDQLTNQAGYAAIYREVYPEKRQ